MHQLNIYSPRWLGCSCKLSGCNKGFPNHEAIAAAKGGIIGLVRSAAATYAGSKLKVYAVAPGLTETKLTKDLTSNLAARKASEDMHPLGRLGTPEDIARAILFFFRTQMIGLPVKFLPWMVV